MTETTTIGVGPARPAAHWPTSPVVFARLALVICCLGLFTATVPDPDLWGHVKFGGDTVAAHFAVPRVDPYSFTSDREWVNHEWLSEVMMYGAWRAGGALGLVLLKAMLLAAICAFVFWSLWRRLGDRAAVDLLAIAAVVAILPRAGTLRPQLFSLVLFCLLLALIIEVDRGRRGALVAIPAVFLAWANLHGGWLVGALVLLVWTAFRVVRPGITSRSRVELLVAGCASAAATFVNPYGIGLWRFLGATVGLGRADISEWRPLLQTGPVTIAVWTGLCLLALVAVGRRRRNDLATLAVVALLGFASFRVNRLDMFFGPAVILLLGPDLTRFAPVSNLTHRAPRPAGKRLLLVAAAVFVLLPLAVTLGAKAACVPVRAAWLPERDAGRFVLENHLKGRMITWFDFGEYAIWHFSPSLRISFDGRRETVYSRQALLENYSFFWGLPGHLDFADRVGADYAWLRNDLPIVQPLERRGWVRIFRGPISSIFARPGDPRRYVQPARFTGVGCFPGP